MKKIATVLIFAGASLFAVTPAIAAPHNPHQEEQDGCDHGHTGKSCKPDPQPDHGKDCVKHGKHGGINEDHCSTTTTTAPTTTTTVPEVTTTTVPEVTTTTVPEVTTTTVPEVTTTTVPEVTTTTVPGGGVVTAAPVAPASTTLAHTGAGSLMLALYGAAAAMLGIGLSLMGKSLKRAVN